MEKGYDTPCYFKMRCILSLVIIIGDPPDISRLGTRPTKTRTLYTILFWAHIYITLTWIVTLFTFMDKSSRENVFLFFMVNETITAY